MKTLVRPRNAPLALLMSLILPGFGQLYNGEPNRAIWLFLGYCALGVPGIAIIALYLPSGMTMAGLALDLCSMLALWTYGMTDAWKAARRRPDFVPRAWQTSGLYLLVLIMCALIVQPLFGSYVQTHEVESFRLPSSSMEPTLMHGDFIFSDKRYNCPNCKQAVRRGDIAIFTFPNDRTLYYVKRIIGLPGERVEIKGHDVLINGRSLSIGELRGSVRDARGSMSELRGPVSNPRSSVSEPRGSAERRVSEGDSLKHWQVVWSAEPPTPAEVDVTVPAGQVYVLGDNRNGSVDSRVFGTVPLQDVIGRVRQVWFSYADGAVRWNRMGKVVE